MSVETKSNDEGWVDVSPSSEKVAPAATEDNWENVDQTGTPAQETTRAGQYETVPNSPALTGATVALAPSALKHVPYVRNVVPDVYEIMREKMLPSVKAAPSTPNLTGTPLDRTPFQPTGRSVEQSVNNWRTYAQAQNEAAKGVRRATELNKKFPNLEIKAPVIGANVAKEAPEEIGAMRVALNKIRPLAIAAGKNPIVRKLFPPVALFGAGYAGQELYNQTHNPDDHAAGGPIQGYADGGKILDILKKAYQGANKSGAQLAREANYVHNIVPTHNFSPSKQISIQDLQGGILVPVPGDRSLTGHRILSVNGVPLSGGGVESQGGPWFGKQKLDQGIQDFWASQFPTASTFQGKVNAASELHGGKPVYGQYAAMDTDAANYALHKTKALMQQMPAMNPSKENIQAFNNIIREKHPDFWGVEHPDVMQQLTLAPEIRKYVADRLNTPKIANALGMPSGEATIHAITQPELRNVATGTTGFSVGKLEPGGILTPSSHGTYNTNIPGTYQGEMIAQLPWQDYFPNAAAEIAANPRQANHAWGTFKMGSYSQPVNQELVDKIAPIEEVIKSGGLDFLKGQ
jgi:hypothetical protein